MLAFTVCSGKVKRTPNKPSLEMSFNKVTSAFGVNLTLSKVQLEQRLPLFLAWEKLGVGFLRARKAARLSQEAAVQLCSEWQYCLEPGCSALCWEPVLGPLRAGSTAQAAGPWHEG